MTQTEKDTHPEVDTHATVNRRAFSVLQFVLYGPDMVALRDRIERERKAAEGPRCDSCLGRTVDTEEGPVCGTGCTRQ